MLSMYSPTRICLVTWHIMPSSALLAKWKSDLLGPHLADLVPCTHFLDLSSTKPSHTNYSYLRSTFEAIYNFFMSNLPMFDNPTSLGVRRRRELERGKIK